MKPSPINLVSAVDDAFSLPLAVMVRSVLDRLDSSRQVRLFVLDGGITDGSKNRLLASWPDPRLTVEWHKPSASLVSSFQDDGRIRVTAYFRIILPRLMPGDVSRALYLDADMLVRRDIGQLWDDWQDGPHCAAVQDSGAPYYDARHTLANFDRCSRWLAVPTPIPNFRDLGLPGDGMYFNSGLMLIDVAKWRADDLTGRMLSCLKDNARHLLFHDQYALNVVLSGKWRALDPRWNQMSRIFRFPSWEDSPFDESTFQAIKHDPYIVHFTSVPKPWQALCRHVYRHEYIQSLDRTGWAGSRPHAWEIARTWSVRQWAAMERSGRHACSRIKRLATT